MSAFNFLGMLDVSHLEDIWLSTIFPQSVACFFIIFEGVIHRAKVFNFDEI